MHLIFSSFSWFFPKQQNNRNLKSGGQKENGVGWNGICRKGAGRKGKVIKVISRLPHLKCFPIESFFFFFFGWNMCSEKETYLSFHLMSSRCSANSKHIMQMLSAENVLSAWCYHWTHFLCSSLHVRICRVNTHDRYKSAQMLEWTVDWQQSWSNLPTNELKW